MNYLVFINGLGPNHKGEYMYEFIFSDNLTINGEGWDETPSHGQASPPDLQFIKKVGTFKSNSIKFDLVQNSDLFGMEDAKDNVIALGWEIEVTNPNNKRLVFLFGEEEKLIKDKLYSRDIALEFEKETAYEID